MFGVVVFQDLVLAEVEGIPDDLDIQRFVYDDLRFYLDRLSIAWLALGAILAVSMTILWTAPIASFQMAYEERVFWAVYMAFCFAAVSLIVVLFVGYPIIGRMRRIRDGGGILKKCVTSQAVYPLSEQHGLKARERRYTAHEEGKHWE